MGRPSNILPLRSKSAETKDSPEAGLERWVQEHRALLDIFLDSYCVVDLQNRVVNFNLAFTTLCDVSFRKAKKLSDFDKLLKIENSIEKEPAKAVIQTQKTLRIDEIEATTSSGGKRKLILGGVPIEDDDGKPMGALLTIRDVSAEDALQRKYLARKEESVTDGLTRLYNKMFVEEMLIRMVRSSLRNVQGFSVVMCDIDYFKKVNDVYGHQAGDYVLSCVAQILKGEVRGTDIVGRFGGEEFIILLHSNNVAGATIFAERLRAKVEAQTFKYAGRSIPATVSVGTATFNEKWKKGIDETLLAQEIIDRADQALYEAKNRGRNSVVQFENLRKNSA